MSTIFWGWLSVALFVYGLTSVVMTASILLGCKRELEVAGTILNGLHWSVAALLGLAWPLLLVEALRSK